MYNVADSFRIHGRLAVSYYGEEVPWISCGWILLLILIVTVMKDLWSNKCCFKTSGL